MNLVHLIYIQYVLIFPSCHALRRPKKVYDYEVRDRFAFKVASMVQRNTDLPWVTPQIVAAARILEDKGRLPANKAAPYAASLEAATKTLAVSAVGAWNL